MSDSNDVILAALTERVLQSIDASEHDRNASLVFSVSALCLLVRLRLITIDDAIAQIDAVLSRLPADVNVDSVAERVAVGMDWLRACGSDYLDGTTVEGSLATPQSRDRKG